MTAQALGRSRAGQQNEAKCKKAPPLGELFVVQLAGSMQKGKDGALVQRELSANAD